MTHPTRRSTSFFNERFRPRREPSYGAEEHAEHRITITLTKLAATVQLQVADDGPGIPAELRDIVFERFVRVDTARTRDTGGTGLGLAIVADVVASHHGSITVTDSDPHGATFSVELPAHQPT